MPSRVFKNIEQDVINLYGENLSPKKIGRMYGVSPVPVRRVLREAGVKLRDRSSGNRRYAINEHFFDVIDSEEKAYFLGMLYADGYNNRRTSCVALSLKESDREILEKLNDAIGSGRPLQRVVHKNTYSKNGCITMRLSLNGQHISRQLEEIGCVQKKTFALQFPSWMPRGLWRHFIRGYVDGDGSIDRNPLKSRLRLSLVSSSSFCSQLYEVFLMELGVVAFVYHPKRLKDGLDWFQVSGNQKTQVVLDWLYGDSNISMRRKHIQATPSYTGA